MKPKVTVLMSVYNGERYLSEAMESILAQTWTDFEFLIINDASTDRSREIILSYRDPRIRLLDNPANIGLTKSLNRGLAQAQGSLIARQDQDDISCPERLERQVEFLNKHPEVALLGTRANIINEIGRIVHQPLTQKATSSIGIKWQFMLYNPFVHSSVMFREEVCAKLGGYDESVQRQDYELWSRIAASHEVANLPAALVKFRIHPASMTAKAIPEDLQSIEKVMLGNMRRYLNDHQVPAAWMKIIVWMLQEKPSEPIETPSNPLEIITSIRRRFLQVNPQAQEDPELRSLMACDLIRAALIMAPRQRWVSLKAFSWAWREERAVAFSSAAKYLALLLLGEPLARSLYCRFQSLLTVKR